MRLKSNHLQRARLFLLLPVAVAALAFARAPSPVPYTEWSRAYCVQQSETVRVVSNAREWTRLCELLGERPPRPLKKNEKAIGIFLGAKPTGGYGVSVDEVKPAAATIRVDYFFEIPSPRDIVSQSFTSPCTILAVETGALPLTAHRLATR